MSEAKIAVIVPCYRSKARVLDVLAGIGPECALIVVVDDACPEGTGAHVEQHCRDARVRVVRHAVNQGVGGATLSGYRAALAADADVLVKLDSDGQMDPARIPTLVAPILQGEADYTKGNRFFDLEGLAPMPVVRLIGNAALSFLNKLSSGYWEIYDPTNGFTALHASVARALPFEKLAQRYFFESDLLFRLGTLRAVVLDVPMPAHYGDEHSGLSVARALPEFAGRHLVNGLKRLVYGYYLRDFNFASLELVLGLPLLVGGAWFGVRSWSEASRAGVLTSSGTVMLAALPILLGVQLLLGFLQHDMHASPRQPLHRRLAARRA